MSNEAKKQLTEEERLSNDKKRASAVRLETEGDELVKAGNREEAAEHWFSSWNLWSHLIAKDVKHESWDDFLRISLKYGDLCGELGDTEHMARVAALILNIALRRFEIGSAGMIAAIALSDEKLGQAFQIAGQVEDAAMRYKAAAMQYARVGNTAKADECWKIEAELRYSLS